MRLRFVPSLGILALLVFQCLEVQAAPLRQTLVLDGTWQVGESVGAEEIPNRFDHTAPVPGLTHQAEPSFPDVDQYETASFRAMMILKKLLPPDRKLAELTAYTPQQRNYFWYGRTFTAPAKKERAELVVNKAQFGTAVWLNGKKIGEHLGCFTAGHFDVTEAIRWEGENKLLIRIGAHPGALPESAFWGNDGEKAVWTPGIYDSVSLRLADNPIIKTIQVAPQIETSSIIVQTRLKNYGRDQSVDLTQQVKTWKGEQPVGKPLRRHVQLAAGEEKVVIQAIPVPDAVWWSPENPFLYVLDTSTGGDSSTTRFGMREFRFDRTTGHALLNGKPIFLRGASITLHRFFGDPKSGGLPWDDKWVRKFLVEIPKEKMHWNAFRICLGPAPQRWLDIADEAGLLIQWEFPIWCSRSTPYFKFWNEADITAELGEFMRDNWNHPSVVIWDASNETDRWDFLKKKLVPSVRGLDLSDRPWENSVCNPQGPDDPIEDHPYLFINPKFQMTNLETMKGIRGKWNPDPPAIINEYDWLWLHRDGTPTPFSQNIYSRHCGPKATPDECRAFHAYTLGGLTEFWRAYRQYAGVLYLAYLDADLPHCFTCDDFQDVQKLQLEPFFADYMGEAFKPLGVYVNFWQPALAAGTRRSYEVLMVNDTQEAIRGRLELVWQRKNGQATELRVATPFTVAQAGQATCNMEIVAPTEAGEYVLTARAYCDGKPWSPTIARRKVTVTSPLTK